MHPGEPLTIASAIPFPLLLGEGLRQKAGRLLVAQPARSGTDQGGGQAPESPVTRALPGGHQRPTHGGPVHRRLAIPDHGMQDVRRGQVATAGHHGGAGLEWGGDPPLGGEALARQAVEARALGRERCQ